MSQNRTRRKKSRLNDWQGDTDNQDTLARKQNRKRRKCVANQRDCMAKAFQVHLQEIVDNTIVRESELPDELISNGCLTEDECHYIRNKQNRKDQIRTLMVIIRGRDLRNMEHLLRYIEKDNRDLAVKIRNCYKDLIKDGYRDKLCLRCKLKTHVDVKSVADCLHAGDMISERLYNQIVMTDAPLGAQDQLWDKLIDGLESHTEPKQAFVSLKSCLLGKGHYVHLADDMDHFLVDGIKLSECICNVLLRPQPMHSAASSNSDSPELLSSDNLDHTESVELRSVVEPRSPRPEAMFFPADMFASSTVMEACPDIEEEVVELRQGRQRRRVDRPMAVYIPRQFEERFLAEVVLEADPRITDV